MNSLQQEKYIALYYAMTDYMAGDVRRIQHFVKVHDYSRLIGLSEGLDEHTQFILEIAALMHDIGIRQGERLYGRNDGEIQQKIGPGQAEIILQDLEFDAEDIARICYLIGHHHTYENMDGMDYQILVEADFLVNLQEDNCSLSACQNAYDRIFVTRSGRQLMRNLFILSSTEENKN